VSVLWLGAVGVALGFVLRGFNRYLDSRMADDVLKDWAMQLELLDPEEREHARLTPPPHVVEAMVNLVPKGLTGALLASRH
jgi:hypothetical protein